MPYLTEVLNPRKGRSDAVPGRGQQADLTLTPPILS
jgi:hypothetical protein